MNKDVEIIVEMIKNFSVSLILFLKKTKIKIENWTNNGSKKVFSWFRIIAKTGIDKILKIKKFLFFKFFENVLIKKTKFIKQKIFKTLFTLEVPRISW